MNYDEQLNLIKSNELFWGLDDEILLSALTEDVLEEKGYPPGELVFGEDKCGSSIGIVSSGKCTVKNAASDAYLSSLSHGEIFGCQSLFLGADSFPGKITAKTQVNILYISRSGIESLMALSPTFSVSYIRYLSQRIAFLNKRIGNFTGKSAESRLAAYLADKFEDYKTFHLESSVTNLAGVLNIGRASLYRAFDALEDAGAIEKDEKIIRLKDKEKLISFIQKG